MTPEIPVNVELSVSEIKSAENILAPKPDGEKLSEEKLDELLEKASDQSENSTLNAMKKEPSDTDFARLLNQPDNHHLI